MNKTKNHNIILASIFSALALLLSLSSLIYIIDRYPLSFNGLYLFITGLLIFVSSVFLITGILVTHKTLIAISGILLCIQSVLYAIFIELKASLSGFYSPFYVIGESLRFIIMLIPAIAFLALTLYVLGVIKNKNFIFISLFISWIIILLDSFTTELAPEVFLISAYMLLLRYVNISDLGHSVKMGEVFVLSIITFGIYYILWCIYTVKKTEFFLEKKAKISEIVFFILFFPYTSYWYYTRYEDLNKSDYQLKNRGTLLMVISLLFLSPLSLCILQRDLNLLSDTVSADDSLSESKDDFDKNYNEENTYDSLESEDTSDDTDNILSEQLDGISKEE